MDVENKDALILWKEALKLIITNGEDYTDNDSRVCREVYNLVLTLKNPIKNIEGPMNSLIKSKKWVYPSKEELANIIFKEKQAPIYDYTYGGRLFNFAGEFDQIRRFILPLLKKDSSSRRAIALTYDVLRDSNLNNRNVPGIMYIQFRIKKNELIMTTMIRSNDLFFGWPANIYQLSELQTFIAKELNVDVGNLVVVSNSAHVFMEDLENIMTVVGDFE